MRFYGSEGSPAPLKLIAVQKRVCGHGFVFPIKLILNVTGGSADSVQMDDYTRLYSRGMAFHMRSSCQAGCRKCYQRRQMLDWPNGITLRCDINQHSFQELQTLLSHFDSLPHQSTSTPPATSKLLDLAQSSCGHQGMSTTVKYSTLLTQTSSSI